MDQGEDILKMMMEKLKRAYCFYMGPKWERQGISWKRMALLRKGMREADRDCPLPKKQKKWAMKRGFFPYRMWQYNLSESNYRTIISDWDYAYLYPLNNKYRDLVINKLTAWYVLRPFSQYMPQHFYHLMKNRDVMRLGDCPEEFDASVDGILRLIRKQGSVAVKKTDGSHGVGFYCVKADGNDFEANGKHYTESAFRDFLKGLDDYIITEYIKQHPLMEKLNPHSVNTIRLTVVNEHGNDPMIPFAFLRVGTRKSGATDNVGAGGMVCRIDVKTGRFYDGEVLHDHVFSKAPVHPDSNEKMEGVIPNWDAVLNGVLDVCRYLPQLEWLGFDIAITPESFSIVEINTMQDMQKAHEYPEEIKGYLFRKLKSKKAAHGKK